MENSINDLQWESGEWEAPDGKMIKFERSDITKFFELGWMYDRWHDDPFILIEVTRWPRKVSIAAIVNEGVDGYTSDGDGDGVIFDVVLKTICPLMTTDRATFQRDFNKIIDNLKPLVSKIDSKY